MDTFVVRTVLVPSTVVLLGRWNWWPSRLSRVPADRPGDDGYGGGGGPGDGGPGDGPSGPGGAALPGGRPVTVPAGPADTRGEPVGVPGRPADSQDQPDAAVVQSEVAPEADPGKPVGTPPR